MPPEGDDRVVVTDPGSEEELARATAEAEAGSQGAAERLAALLRDRHRINRANPDPAVLSRWLDIAVDDLASHPDGFAAVHRGDADGFLIRGVLTAEQATHFAEGVHASPHAHANMGGSLIGTSLLGLEQLDGYFAEAPVTSDRLDELLGFSFQRRIEEVFTALGGGRGASVPRHPSGASYLPATVRILDPRQGAYRAHTGNEFVETFVSYDHLRSIAELDNALSYFVQLQRPQVGGELVIYDLAWDQTPPEFHDRFLSATRDAKLEHYPMAYVDPLPGDMVLFNGGRIWHKVADIEGDASRITVGGFSTISSDDSTIYYWN